MLKTNREKERAEIVSQTYVRYLGIRLSLSHCEFVVAEK